MTEAVLTGGSGRNSVADKTLKTAATFWFLVAVLGQWVFVYYIVTFYGNSAVQGDFEAWNKVLPHGIIPGDTMGNVAIAMHLFLAAVITVGGPLHPIDQWEAKRFQR